MRKNNKNFIVRARAHARTIYIGLQISKDLNKMLQNKFCFAKIYTYLND